MGYARIKAKMNELKEIFDKKREERGERRKSPSKTADRYRFLWLTVIDPKYFIKTRRTRKANFS